MRIEHPSILANSEEQLDVRTQPNNYGSRSFTDDDGPPRRTVPDQPLCANPAAQSAQRSRDSGGALKLQILRSCQAAGVGLLALFAVTGVASAATIVFSDGTFAPGNYSTAFTYLQNPGSDSATWSQCASCGNPNQALQLVINESTGGGTFNSTEALTGILKT